MESRKVNYKVKYKGEETIDLEPGKIYKCVEETYDEGELLSLGIIDDSGEDYQYDPADFEKL